MPAIEGTTQDALAKLQAAINADPEIQQLLTSNADRIRATHDRGGDARKFQNSLRDQITNIAQRKGYLPKTDQVFINPNNGQLEGHGGWAGLNGVTKALIIAAAGGAATMGLGALGAFGGAGAAAGGGGAATGATSAAAGAAPSMIMPGMVPTLSAGTLATMGTGAGTAAATGAGAAGTAGLWGRLAQSAMTPEGVGAIASAATGMARGAGDDRVQGVGYQVERDRLGLDAQAQYERDQQARAELQMRQQESASQTGTQAFQNALRAATVRGFQPANRPQGVANISFVGQGPQMARPAAEAMDREAMLRLMEGPQQTQLPPLERYTLNSPTEMPGQSLLEKIAGPLGLAGTAYSNFFRRQNQQQGQV